MDAIRHHLELADQRQVDFSLHLSELVRRQAAMQVDLDNSQLERNRLISDLAAVRQQIDPTVKALQETRQEIASLQHQLQEAMEDNQRLQNSNQTNSDQLADSMARLDTLQRDYTALRADHVVLQGTYRDTDKRLRYFQRRYDQVLVHNEKEQEKSDRRDRMLTRLRKSKHTLRLQLRGRIRLLLHTINTQARQSTRYSRQLDAIQQTYPNVVIPVIEEEEEDDIQHNDPILLENLPTDEDERYSQGEVTPPDSPRSSEDQHPGDDDDDPPGDQLPHQPGQGDHEPGNDEGQQDPTGDPHDPAGGQQDPAGGQQDPTGRHQDPPGGQQDPPGGQEDPTGGQQDPQEQPPSSPTSTVLPQAPDPAPEDTPALDITDLSRKPHRRLVRSLYEPTSADRLPC